MNQSRHVWHITWGCKVSDHRSRCEACDWVWWSSGRRPSSSCGRTCPGSRSFRPCCCWDVEPSSCCWTLTSCRTRSGRKRCRWCIPKDGWNKVFTSIAMLSSVQRLNMINKTRDKSLQNLADIFPSHCCPSYVTWYQIELRGCKSPASSVRGQLLYSRENLMLEHICRHFCLQTREFLSRPASPFVPLKELKKTILKLSTWKWNVYRWQLIIPLVWLKQYVTSLPS